MSNRFHGEGLYFLDEPEAALSPMRQMTLVALLHQLARAGSQFVIATHPPILMAYPGAHILQFDGAAVRRVSYEDTEHFRVTRDFLNRYPKMLEVLLDEGASSDEP